MSRDAVTRDVELEAAHEEINRLKSDLAQRKDDLDRYTHFLAHFVCVCVCVSLSLSLCLHSFTFFVFVDIVCILILIDKMRKSTHKGVN